MPVFRTPEGAVDAFHSIASFYRNQQLLQQTPPPLSHLAEPDTEGARLLIEGVLAERRKVLTEMESKALLAAFHIPVTRTMLARSANEAMLIASQLGYPVALKIDSPDIIAQERRAGRGAGRAQRHPGARPLPGDARRRWRWPSPQRASTASPCSPWPAAPAKARAARSTSA